MRRAGGDGALGAGLGRGTAVGTGTGAEVGVEMDGSLGVGSLEVDMGPVDDSGAAVGAVGTVGAGEVDGSVTLSLDLWYCHGLPRRRDWGLLPRSGRWRD